MRGKRPTEYCLASQRIEDALKLLELPTNYDIIQQFTVNYPMQKSFVPYTYKLKSDGMRKGKKPPEKEDGKE